MDARQGVAGFDSFAADGAQDTSTARRTLGLLVGALAVIACFRLVALALNGTDLFMDEAQYWAWSREPAFGYYSKPPLVAWIIHGATAVCGDGEACVRFPATLLHIATAVLVYAIGARLYTPSIGLVSALAYALLPAISLSSGIISTDVPLLAAWALALFAFAGLMAAPSWSGALLLALALGAGLNAKYSMAYFVLCAGLYFAVAPEARSRLKEPHLWVALASGAALLVPNMLWNAAHGFATVSHTAENANWRGIPFHPGKAAEFLVSQFGVLGPILFGALLVIAWRAARDPRSIAKADKLLLAFSLPVIALVTAQAFISRAHANWAAPAYIAAVVLVTAVMVRDRAFGWMKASFALHAVLAVVVALATWQAGHVTVIGIGNPLSRTLGNRELAAAVRTELADAADRGAPYRSILADSRDTVTALAYYGRDFTIPLFAWRDGAAPRNHFEMSQPFGAESPEPALLVTSEAHPPLLAAFAQAKPLGTRSIEAGATTTRSIHLFALSGIKQR
jgi:hypothetical protein